MSAGIWNPVIEQGADFNRVVAWEDESGPVDPSDYIATMQVRAPSGLLLVDLSSVDPPGGITIDGVLNTLTIFIPAVETTLMTWQRGLYDLKLTHTSGMPVFRLLEGAVEISEAQTI